MKAVLQGIRILVIILLIEKTCCQDGYSDQDILRLQQMAANEGQIETITSYSTNIIQRDPSSHSISSVSVQYHMTDDADKNDDNNRSDRSRTKKVYRIKNPFQRQTDEDERLQDVKPQDNGTGASNQYAAMQYSLPPEDFLQQMRAENQYQQQQLQQQQQPSTQSTSLGYTATPQPQYQYSTISTSNYDFSNQQPNQISQLEPKSLSQVYHSNTNNFQYNSPNSYGLDIVQSTPSPISQFMSTPLPNNQYLATPSNTFVSSSSPMYLSSPPSLQQYVSSPLSNIQTGLPEFNSNRVTTTIGSNSLSYENNDLNKKMHIDHYDNSAHGVRYPIHQQYEYSSSTLTPSSSFPEFNRDSWQNGINNGLNSKSAQELTQSQFQNLRYNNNNQQESKHDTSYDNINSDTHRVGSLPSANNVYLNFVQPDYQLLNSLKSRAREYEQETPQPEYYSHGDYGWKLSGKKSYITQEGPTQANYPRYQIQQQADTNPISQMNFHLDTSKSYNYDQTSKSSSEKLDAQEFAKAAAKAHEQYKQQLEANNYPSSTQYNQNLNMGSSSILYGNHNDKQKKLYSEGLGQNSYSQNNQQSDLITLSPYYYTNLRENSLDSKTKQPFDHDKALKNIVPIDVSNVVSNSENQVRLSSPYESNTRYSFSNYAKEQNEQNTIKQYYKPLTDSYYKDKNAIYGFNIKTKPEDTVLPDRVKQIESNIPVQSKPQQSESFYNHGGYNDNKRFTDDTSQPHYLSQLNHYQDNVQSSANVQQQGVIRPVNQITSDLSSILKLNDIPFRLTQGLSADSLRLHNSNFDQSGIPTPLPVRLNQNVDNHQIDVAANILNKLMSNKPSSLTIGRPEVELQNGNLLSLNGFKVANPYNMDLKLVADMLKGKTTIDESNISPLRDQFNKPVPLKLDLSQLQQLLLKNDANLGLINNGHSSLSSPFFEVYNPSGYYQGNKYSRSQEEEENIPIADASSTHPIGAVMEEDDSINSQEVNTGLDTTAVDDDGISVSLTEDRPKNVYSSSFRAFVERHRHPNSLLSGRHSVKRKYPKSEIDEPYPLLKPPPRTSRNRAYHNNADKPNRRRRVNKPKILRIFKIEPLFEAESSSEEEDKPSVTTLLKPPPVAEDKSDITDDMEGA